MVEKFNYYEFIKVVEKTCLSHPFVSNFYTGRYRLNSTDDIEYPAIVMTTNNIAVGENITTVNFNLMYVDRLTEKRDNILLIQSVGIDTISEINNALKQCFDMDSTDNLTFNVFEEQFADNVAGVVTPVSFYMPSNIGSCFWFNPKNICEKC